MSWHNDCPSKGPLGRTEPYVGSEPFFLVSTSVDLPTWSFGEDELDVVIGEREPVPPGQNSIMYPDARLLAQVKSTVGGP